MSVIEDGLFHFSICVLPPSSSLGVLDELFFCEFGHFHSYFSFNQIIECTLYLFPFYHTQELTNRTQFFKASLAKRTR